jgi:hypothetical protein
MAEAGQMIIFDVKPTKIRITVIHNAKKGAYAPG